MMRKQLLWWLMVFGILTIAWGTLLSSGPLSSASGLVSVTPTLIVSDRQFLPGVLGAATGPTATATTPPPTMTPSPTPTATPESPPPVAQGTLKPDAVARGTLDPASVHQWDVFLTTDDVITLQAVPLPLVSLTLTLTAENGSPIARAETPAPGAVARINDVALGAGIYHVLISSDAVNVDGVNVDATAVTDYALFLTDIDSPLTNLAGALRASDTSSGTLAEATDDLWVFSGGAGTRISLSIVGEPGTDPYAELYDPFDARLVIIDDGGIDEPEQLSDFTLPADGIYVLQIGEFEFNAMAYQVMFQR